MLIAIGKMKSVSFVKLYYWLDVPWWMIMVECDDNSCSDDANSNDSARICRHGHHCCFVIEAIVVVSSNHRLVQFDKGHTRPLLVLTYLNCFIAIVVVDFVGLTSCGVD